MRMSRTTPRLKRNLVKSQTTRSKERINGYLNNFLTLPKTDYTYADTGSYRSRCIGQDYEVPNMTRYPTDSSPRLGNSSLFDVSTDISPMTLRSGLRIGNSSRMWYQHSMRLKLIDYIKSLYHWSLSVVSSVMLFGSRSNDDHPNHVSIDGSYRDTTISSAYGLDVDEDAVDSLHVNTQSSSSSIVYVWNTTIEKLSSIFTQFTSVVKSTFHEEYIYNESESHKSRWTFGGCSWCCLLPLLLLLGLFYLVPLPGPLLNHSSSEQIPVSWPEKNVDIEALIKEAISEHLSMIGPKFSELNTRFMTIERKLSDLEQNTEEHIIFNKIDSQTYSIKSEILAEIQKIIDELKQSMSHRDAAGAAASSLIDKKLSQFSLEMQKLKEQSDSNLLVVDKNNQDVKLALSTVSQTMHGKLQELSAEIEFLKHEFDKLKISRQRSDEDKVTSTSSVDYQRVSNLIDAALLKFSADKTGMADYALETAGGSVISILCSETFSHKTALVSLWGFPLYYQAYSPRTVIQPGTNPGECWAFKGSQGHLVVKLSAVIIPTVFTLEHIPRSLVTNNISSSPRDFSIYGLESEDYNTAVSLGNYTYDIYAPDPVQYFIVQATNVLPVQYVWLKVTSNYGNIRYTCLYRFRVHGNRVGS